MTWTVKVLTLFPELFPGPLSISIVGNALQNQKWSLDVHNIRNYAFNRHKTVDEPPYGGGAGMVMRPDILGNAIDSVFASSKNCEIPVIYLSPRGSLFDQRMAHKLVTYPGINLICGRFEGIDERVIKEFGILELSIGDYVLSSGDLAAFIVIDTCVRLLPGVIEQKDALKEETFGTHPEYKNLLEYPHYTRPCMWKGHEVPKVLLSGNHAAIAKWRLEQAKHKTATNRQDLWQRYLIQVV
ncbi:tRNA (guanine-N(1)-)-methyltransferase [Alphaproteobacteria bacterium]